MDQIIKSISDRTPHTITLTRHSGEKHTFMIRRCDETNIDEFMALQQKICDEIDDPEIYSLVDREELLESLEHDYCFGVYLERADEKRMEEAMKHPGASCGSDPSVAVDAAVTSDAHAAADAPEPSDVPESSDAPEPSDGSELQLVAFTVMIANRISCRNYGTYIGYTPEQQLKCVSMEITVVDDPCRGFGMQRLFVQLREGVARELGATQAMVTIGPENKYSLNNLQASGYEIIDTRPMYEGAMRHILRKQL